MKNVKISVKGKVQGVFFRSETQKKARELNLGGWVKNEADGTVTILASGRDNQITEFIQWCSSNPGYSSVSGINVEDLPANQKINGEFTIKR